jgi:polyadenylate-binding protein 2
MKARVQEMESEAAKLRDMQAEVEKSMYPVEEGKKTTPFPTIVR